MDLRWRVREKKSHRIMNSRVRDPVIVFQEQVRLVVNVGQVIDQARYNRLQIDQEGLIDQIERIRANSGHRALYRLRHIEEKAGRLVVIGIDRQPRDRSSTLAKPLTPGGGKRGLAESCGCLD